MIVVTPNLSSKCSRLVRSSALSRLEGESREEPTRLASLELRLEELLSLLLRRNLLGGVVQSIRGDDVLEVVGDVEGVARRHEVRPGITGWAQINGRNAISWEDKFDLDVWYVDHCSLWLDIIILWITVRKVLRRDGISLAGEATMTRFKGSRSNKGFGK